MVTTRSGSAAKGRGRTTPAAVTPKRRARARVVDSDEDAEWRGSKPRLQVSKSTIATRTAAARASAAAGMKAQKQRIAATELVSKAKKQRIAATPPVSKEIATLQRAAAALRPGSFDASFQGILPCREQEQQDIRAHLHTAVKQGSSVQVLYVSGMPGTGKTASVLRALAHMKKAKDVPAFTTVHINAMRLGSPNAVFGLIRSQLQKGPAQRCTAAAAPGELTNFFERRRSCDPVVVLLVDEIDHLVTKSQTVLYRVFDWLSLPSPRLVVVAISNTMDLPERLLPRVASRFGIVRVEYQPYDREQIVKIISQRLAEASAEDALSNVVLKLSAAKIAASSGDIRKALQVLRRAVEVRLSAGAGVTGPTEWEHLAAAEQDLLRANPAARAIQGLSILARRLLTALLLNLRTLRADVAPLHDVTLRYGKLVDAADPLVEAAPTPVISKSFSLEHDVRFLVDRLEAMALLTQPIGSAGPSLALGGGLDVEDLAAALEAVEENPGIRELIEDSAPPRM